MRAKPNLIFFQYKYDDRLPAFLLAHKQEHVRCLSQFFNVTVIDHDCDYEQICDMHQPDLALFEGGVPFPSCDRPKITSPSAHSHVPKLGFLHSDAFCCGRAGFLSDMDHLGISTYFAIATAAAENTPTISDSLFVWPNFVDPELYRDYGLWKSIPVLFAGNSTALYPWRQRMARLISKEFPSLICNHPGYAPQKKQQQIRVGEPYARMLNASWFVPSCGTLAKEVVRKHFEVPACKSCLVAERSPALEAAGFVDMVNCVFADDNDVLDKLAHLFKNQDELEAIIQAGFELVHRSHTIKQRDQILQWYELNKKVQAHQTIIQPGPFEPLRIVDRPSDRAASNLTPNGLHLQLLQQGDELLSQHDFQSAERLYLKCAQYIPWMPEPKLRLAICNLHKGNAKAALSWVSDPIQFTLSEYRAVDPDPVEWAYFIIATICSGDLGAAIKRAKEFPQLRHQELNRARQALMIVTDCKTPALVEGDQSNEHHRRSIHQLPQCNDDEWFRTLCELLTACSQRELAGKLSTYLSRSREGLEEASKYATGALLREEGEERSDGRASVSRATARHFRWRLRSSKMRMNLKKAIRSGLYRAEARYGYFLPHHISSSRDDEFYKTIYELALGESVKTALILGSDWRRRSTQALIAGFRDREAQSGVVYLGMTGQVPGSRGEGRKGGLVRWYGTLSPGTGGMRDQLRRAIVEIRQDSDIEQFDVVLIDGCLSIQGDNTDEALLETLLAAKYVLLDDVSNSNIHEIYRYLQREQRHEVIGENPDLRNGYAVFARRQPNVLTRAQLAAG